MNSLNSGANNTTLLQNNVAGSANAQPTSTSVDAGPVQAYAKLEGEDFCYYIRTLQVTLGRKAAKPDNVDIPLGNTKSVSRQHARVFYNFTTQRFEMMVFGKNGAFVNEQFVERGATVPLENRTKIQIGEVSFVFLLPRMDVEDSPRNESAGYISTPQQLEKQSSSRKDDQKEKEDSIGINDGNETPEPNPYSSKDVKPPYSYASLIAQAINSTGDKRMTLNGIYTYITTHYPYYQMVQNGWQNSIRHNLSLNKAFVKVPRGDTEPGKGAFWTIDANAETQFANGIYKKNKRPSTKGGSSPTSPTSPMMGEARKRFKKEGSDSDDDSIDALNASDIATTMTDMETSATNVDVSSPSYSTPAETITTATTPAATDAFTVAANHASTAMTGENVTSAAAVAAAAATASTKPPSTAGSSLSYMSNISSQAIQAHLQLQLQNTIRQHLLDPVGHPLPASIAQLLPQAIAQLPPQLASQLSATLQSALKAHNASSNNNNNSNPGPSSPSSSLPTPSTNAQSPTKTEPSTSSPSIPPSSPRDK